MRPGDPPPTGRFGSSIRSFIDRCFPRLKSAATNDRLYSPQFAMANNLLRSLAFVGAVAFIPATTASLAQVDVNAYRDIDEFMSVL